VYTELGQARRKLSIIPGKAIHIPFIFDDNLFLSFKLKITHALSVFYLKILAPHEKIKRHATKKM